MLTLALLIAVGVLVCLDRTQLLQVMISRPIVVGPALGAWAGEPLLGVALGIGFEFLYAGRLPVGSHVPPNDTLAAVGGAGLLVFTGTIDTMAEAGVAAALALPLAEVGRGVDIWARKLNGRLAQRIDRQMAQGDWSQIERAPWIALAMAAGAYAGTLLLYFPLAGWALDMLTDGWPGWLEGAFAVFLAGLPFIGLAESTANLDPRRFPRSAVVGLAMGIVLLLLVV